jgi:hypothetical protein
MHHFTQRIRVPLGYFNFYFNRIYTIDGVLFHVSVIDNLKKLHMFNMTEFNGKWIIANPANCIQWIVVLENELSDAIIQHLNSTKK